MTTEMQAGVSARIWELEEMDVFNDRCLCTKVFGSDLHGEGCFLIQMHLHFPW